MTRLRIFLYNDAGEGRTPDGALSINVQNNGAAAALVNGTTIPAGQSVNFPYIEGCTYDAIDYDAQTSNLLISGTFLPLK